jgi:hypothetical protein
MLEIARAEEFQVSLPGAIPKSAGAEPQAGALLAGKHTLENCRHMFGVRIHAEIVADCELLPSCQDLVGCHQLITHRASAASVFT